MPILKGGDSDSEVVPSRSRDTHQHRMHNNCVAPYFAVHPRKIPSFMQIYM